MITRFLIYDIYTNTYFCGLDDMGKPYFGTSYSYPGIFNSEQEAINRLKEEIELWGREFLDSRLIEIRKVYIF